MIVSGIDYSITSPALCVHKGNVWSYFNCHFHIIDNSKNTPLSKCPNITVHKTIENGFIKYMELANIFSCYMEGIIGLEGYSMGSVGKVFNIAENTALLKNEIYKKNLTLMIFSPTEIKSFATNDGKSDKEDMYKHFILDGGEKIIQHYPKRKKIASPISDIVDSYFIAKLAFFRSSFKELL